MVLLLSAQIYQIKVRRMQIFTQELLDYDFKFDVICIQENWLGENDEPLFYSLDGYMYIFHRKTSSSKGGLMIYLKKYYS